MNTESPINGPTWVYYAYCEHDGLLYVGVAGNVERRIAAHRYDKPWWDREVDYVLATLYPTRRQALDVEAHEIKTHRPTHNITGQASTEALPHEVLPHCSSTLRILDKRGRAS